MSTESGYSSGGKRYYIVQRSGRIIVQKVGWLGRSKVGDVHSLEEAFALIKSDSGSSKVDAR